MKSGINGRLFKMWAFAAALAAALPAGADAYLLFPVEAKEARVVFGGNGDAANHVDLINTTRVDCAYSVVTNYSGITLNWDDFGSVPVEYIDLSGFTNYAFGLGGNPSQVKIEFVDTSDRKASTIAVDMTTNVQTYNVAKSVLQINNALFNFARVRFINFIVDNTAVTLTGQFTVRVDGGLPFAYNILPQTTGTLTVLPGQPAAIPVGGANAQTAVDTLSPSNFVVSYGLSTNDFSGATILFDNYGTPTNEHQDLSVFTSVVFAITGRAQNVKIEVDDIYTQRVVATFKSVTNTVQYYSVDMNVIQSKGVDTHQIRGMNFVIDRGLVGAGNETGTFSVLTGGLNFSTNVPVTIGGTNTGTVTVLPGRPTPISLPGGQGTTAFAHLSTQEFSVAYALNATNFAGGMILFDNFGTPDTNESQNLSGFNVLVFGVTGSAANINFEIEDIYTNKASATLLGTQTATVKYYAIPRTNLQDRGVDMTQVRFIGFVVDSNTAGAANLTGAFGIKTGGLKAPPYLVGAAGTGMVSTLPANNQGSLAATSLIGGGNVETTVISPDKNTFTIGYNVCTGGYSGATILFDNFGTAATNESADISGMTTVTFRIRGTASKVNFEVADAVSNSVAGAFTGLTTNYQYYSLNTSVLSQNGLDLTLVRFINFVVDSNSSVSCSGTLDVEILGLYFEPTVSGSTNGPATILPNNPTVTTVGGANGGTIVINTNFSLIEVTYNVTTGFSGAAILWDNFGTTNIESQNLSVFTNLVFGLYGKPSGAKFEFQDASGRVMRAVCAGITTNLQYYRLDAALFTNDLTRISAINIVLDAGLTGAGNTNGKLNIVSGGFIHPFYVTGAGAGAESALPPGPPSVDSTGGSNPGTLVTVMATNRFFLDYRVNVGYAGATISYDLPATTGTVESGDLSGFGSIVFKIRGHAENTKFEFIDTNNVKVSGIFLYVQTNSYQYYSVPSAELTSRNFDLAHVRYINLIEDLESAGLDGSSGRLDVVVGGIYMPTNAPMDIADGDSDGLPDAWELAYFGTITGAVATADSDDDGAINWEEFVSDTNPTNSASVYPNLIEEWIPGIAVMTLQTGSPTTNSRIYDVWVSTNLMSSSWSPRHLNVPGALNGGPVTLVVTNIGELGYYRTGVKLP